MVQDRHCVKTSFQPERFVWNENGTLASAVWTLFLLLFPYVLISSLLSSRLWTIFVEYLQRCFHRYIIYTTAITKWYSEKTRQTIFGSIKQSRARRSACKAGKFGERRNVVWYGGIIFFRAFSLRKISGTKTFVGEVKRLIFKTFTTLNRKFETTLAAGIWSCVNSSKIVVKLWRIRGICISHEMQWKNNIHAVIVIRLTFNH